jgi:hypothetical protein
MRTYHIYLPSPHESIQIGRIEHIPAQNSVTVILSVEKKQTFYGIHAAMKAVQQEYSGAFLEEV